MVDADSTNNQQAYTIQPEIELAYDALDALINHNEFPKWCQERKAHLLVQLDNELYQHSKNSTYIQKLKCQLSYMNTINIYALIDGFGIIPEPTIAQIEKARQQNEPSINTLFNL